jgi:hypothetical protein
LDKPDPRAGELQDKVCDGPRILTASMFLRAFLASLCFTVPAFAQLTVAQDGSGDFNGADEKPILAALAKARAAGGGEIVIKPGIYQLTRSIEMKDAKKITVRGQPGAVLKLPPLQHAETSADAAVGESVLPVRVQQGMAPGVRLRIMAPAGIDSFSGKQKPSFFITLAKTEPGRLVLAQPLEFPVPAGTKIINEDAPNLFELRGACENIAIESLALDGGRTPADPPVSGHAQLCGIFAGGSYNYTKGLTGPPMRHLVVRDCVIRNCFGRGIAFYAVHDALVTGCTIEDTVDEAIDLDHFVVGCQVLDNKAARCHVGVELNDANDSLVARNRFEACDIGINLWRWCKMDDLNTRNQIVENEFVGTKGNGIQLAANTAANIVRGNMVRDSGRNGIVIGGDENEVTGNRVFDAGSAGAGKFDGIYVGGAKNRVLDNVVGTERRPSTMRKSLTDGGRDNTVREPTPQR